MKRLVIDTSNLLWRVASAQGKYHPTESAEDQAGLSMHMALNVLKSFYKKIQPQQVALAFEGTKNWRKEYTKSAECKSGRVYKANRVKDDSKIPFYELISAFENLARAHTSLACLSHPELEGDDVIAGYVQHFAAIGDETVVLSGDKDFIQLLKLPKVSLMNPDDGKLRGWDKKTGEKIDPEFFMFEKAIRGDVGDNVMAAYPRVRSTRIQKAWESEYERTNFMNETWEFSSPSTGEKRIMRVGDLFKENQTLMNLFEQPSHIRQLIDETIKYEILHHGQFSLFEFQRFCAKFGLKKINENAQHFMEFFSSTGRNSPEKEATKANNILTDSQQHLANIRSRSRSTLVF
ncbi:MAG: DNA polymerase I [Syntrophomonadaceae bacterium]|nr:DNA polymerase I [Bacillota bacterium]